MTLDSMPTKTDNLLDEAPSNLLERRTCRCCGRSIMFEERMEVDEFQEGLDVCPDCILHFTRKSCLYGDW